MVAALEAPLLPQAAAVEADSVVAGVVQTYLPAAAFVADA